jgi:hypothetical protein
MLESARKHGPFDDRYRVRQKLPAPSWVLRLDGEGKGSSGLLSWRGSSRSDAGTTSRPSQRTRPTRTSSSKNPSSDRRRTRLFQVAAMVGRPAGGHCAFALAVG